MSILGKGVTKNVIRNKNVDQPKDGVILCIVRVTLPDGDNESTSDSPNGLETGEFAFRL